MLGCNKLDTTDIGGDLIPPVDNVKTFDTLLTVDVRQVLLPDCTRVSNEDNLVLGHISLANDPVFGKTTANIYVQYKPGFYPFYLGAQKDTIQGYPNVGIDSLVVCLSYKGAYGDTAQPQRFEVREIGTASNFKDSVYDFYYLPTDANNLLGSVNVDLRKLKDTVRFRNGRDFAINQIRIPITNAAFLAKFASIDSAASGTNNAYYKDSLWRAFYKGFAISADQGAAYSKSIIYTNLNDPGSRLEVHYRKRPGVYNGGKVDTSFTSLSFARNASGSINASAYANHVVRDWAGSEVTSPAPGAVYLQTGPGIYDTLRINGLSTFPNSIIHRAELIMDQIPGLPFVDRDMLPPNYVYVDIVDSATKNYFRPLVYDLNPDAGYVGFPGTNNINFPYYGGFLRFKADPFGTRIGYYNVNLTRHVQGIVTRKEPNKTLRLMAPFELDYTKTISFFAKFRYVNSLAYGRVKLGDGTNTNYKMKLRIVYSKL
jgi:hypothetical protein